MKITETRDMSDDQWKSAAELEEYLYREIYPEYFEGRDLSWETLKKLSMNALILSDISFANNYYVFDNEECIASAEAFHRRGKLYFVFNNKCKIVTNDDLTIIYSMLLNLLQEKNFEDAYFYTFYERHYDPVIKTGAEVFDETLTSKLLKEDLDFEWLEKIVKEKEATNHYELKFFREIPEEIYERYVTYINEITEDKNFNHPKKEEHTEITMSDLLTRVQDMKDDRDVFYMYMLFDGNNIAAYCSVFIENHNGRPMIEHRGGYTTVGRNYRGQGLAKYLKAKMYLKMQEVYPDYQFMLTDTYPWNTYMYSINEEFGFKPHQKGYTFRFTKEFLKDYLNKYKTKST